ncbi:hypothetical protein BGW38_001930 [Lunasporangiospora selenospora]|uniref:tRNA dimethylallyltransferase n=1 Tax=Lunasporangiospora selenospora TaxID=979761 RepID=A0A9P6G1T3_9FUNG|nr:hypothetical protein BGW38_001930 [Lunasporangiospora selenospora]
MVTENVAAYAVYKGLDIITNKMPIEEREGVVHHLMDFMAMDREYSVLDFKADASKLIKDIHDRDHLPVVVGGTHYYIQSLLWKDTLLDTKKDAGTMSDDEDDTGAKPSTPEEEERPHDAFLRDSDTPTLYKKLQEVDPIMAKKWHENDRRKISRSLQVYFETGQRQSDLIRKQHSSQEVHRLRMPACIFWVYSAPDVLNARLDTRVDKMIKGGLFDEIQGMRKNIGPETDYERGIWQAIGYKEFDPYFSALEKAVTDGEATVSKELETLKAECTEVMKIRTRQYAKRQVQWIRNKLLPLCREEEVKVYILDATSLETWKQNVSDIAISIAKDFFAGNLLPDPKSVCQYAKEMLVPQRSNDTVGALEAWDKKECTLCTEMQRIMHSKSTAPGSTGPTPSPVIIHGPTGLEQHFKSKLHRRMKTNKADMERDGDNWWFFKAQEFKKRRLAGLQKETSIESSSGDVTDNSEMSKDGDDVDRPKPSKIQRLDQAKEYTTKD